MKHKIRKVLNTNLSNFTVFKFLEPTRVRIVIFLVLSFFASGFLLSMLGAGFLFTDLPPIVWESTMPIAWFLLSPVFTLVNFFPRTENMANNWILNITIVVISVNYFYLLAGLLSHIGENIKQQKIHKIVLLVLLLLWLLSKFTMAIFNSFVLLLSVLIVTFVTLFIILFYRKVYRRILIPLSILLILFSVGSFYQAAYFFEEDYCIRVGWRVDPKGGAMVEPTEEEKKGGATQIALSWREHGKCHERFNIFQAVSHVIQEPGFIRNHSYSP